MYIVLHYFTDLKDHGHAYKAGDVFPRKGVTATPERIAELSSDKNRRGKALIKLVEEEKPETPKEPVENFINPPTEPVNPVEEEEKPVKPKRGRKKKD